MKVTDLWLLLVFFVSIDVARRRRVGLNGLASPGLAFAASFSLIYLIPVTAIYFGYEHPRFIPGRLTKARSDELVVALRWMLVFLSGMSFVRLLSVTAAQSSATNERQTPRPQPVIPRIGDALLLVVMVGALATWVLHLVAGVGFSPSALISRALSPREFTNLRVGNGFAIYPRQAILPLYLAAGSLAILQRHRAQERALKAPAMHVALASLLLVLGGNKTAIVISAAYVFSPWVSSRFGTALKINKRQLVGIAILAPVVLYSAFALMRTAALDEAGITPTDHLISYSREPFHTANVIADFDSDIGLMPTVFLDSIRGAVPRALFPDKGDVGLYRRIWKPVYEADRVDFHASTFGALAEAHMFFGSLGPALYGILFSILLLKIERFEMARSLEEWALFLLNLNWVFLFLRAGFSGSALLNYVVVLSVTVAGARLARAGSALLLKDGSAHPAAASA